MIGNLLDEFNNDYEMISFINQEININSRYSPCEAIIVILTAGCFHSSDLDIHRSPVPETSVWKLIVMHNRSIIQLLPQLSPVMTTSDHTTIQLLSIANRGYKPPQLYNHGDIRAKPPQLLSVAFPRRLGSSSPRKAPLKAGARLGLSKMADDTNDKGGEGATGAANWDSFTGVLGSPGISEYLRIFRRTELWDVEFLWVK